MGGCTVPTLNLPRDRCHLEAPLVKSIPGACFGCCAAEDRGDGGKNDQGPRSH